MTEPSPANFVNRIFFGYQNAAVLKAALELDVFTAIGSGTLDVAALAAKSDASPRGIAALCDSLVVMGFLAKSSAGYALTPDAAVFLDREEGRATCTKQSDRVAVTGTDRTRRGPWFVPTGVRVATPSNARALLRHGCSRWRRRARR